jgi:hypothetical protein
MKKSLLLLLIISTILITSCSKSNDEPEIKPLNLNGSIWYGAGEKRVSNGLTYYDHLAFKSETDVDMYNSYLIGQSTDAYTGHLKYTITTPTGSTPIINITGKDAFGTAVNTKYVYDRKDNLILEGASRFTKFK